MSSTDLPKVLGFAYFYLKFRSRTRAEMVKYLEKKSIRYHFGADLIAAAIAQLEEEKLVDDRQFVEMYVHDRTLLKPRSEFLLRQELLKLGVAKDLINDYFAAHPVEETSLAREALERKKRSFDRLAPEERFRKAVSFLMRKGFSYDISKKAYHTLY